MSISSFGVGFLVGFGTGFFSREVLPFAREIINPISRLSFKSAVRVYENSREAVSRLGESVEDMIAEVKQELKKEKVKKKRIRPKPAVVTGVERTV